MSDTTIDPRSTPAYTPLLERLLPLLFCLALLLAIKSALFRVLLDDRPRIDLRVFLIAGEAVNAGASPYIGPDEHQKWFVYPQAFAWLISPLARIDVPTVERLWDAANLLFFIAAVAIPLRWAITHSPPTPGDRRTPLLIATVFFMGLSFSPVHFGWRLGQSDLFLAFIMSLVYTARGTAAPWVAGLCFGLATVLKLSPLMLAPALALAFGWRFLAAYGAVIAAYVALLAARGAIADEIYLLTNQVPYHQFRAAYPASSLHSLVCVQMFPRHFIRPDGYYGGWMTTLITASMLAAYAAAGLWLWWRRASWLTLLTVGIAFSHLASPFLEPHHATSTILVLVPLVFLSFIRRDGAALGIVAAAWLIGALYIDLYGIVPFQIPDYLLLVCDVLLIALALLRPNLGGESPWLLRAGPLHPKEN